MIVWVSSRHPQSRLWPMDSRSSSSALPRNWVLRDPLMRITAIVSFLLAIPFALPLLEGDALYYFGELSDVPLFCLVIYAFQTGKQQLENSRALKFWNLLTLALLCWLTIRVVLNWLPTESRSAALTIDLLYVGFYLFCRAGVTGRASQAWRGSATAGP